jgi:hypothetical protein
MKRTTIADLLGGAFLLLTISHAFETLNQFETSDYLAFFLAVGIDLAIAFASSILFNFKLERYARIIGGVWLAGLLATSYGLNFAHYSNHKADSWSFALASIFPLSLAFLGAIRPALARLDNQGQQQPVANPAIEVVKPVVEPVETVEPIAESEQDNTPLLQSGAEIESKIADLKTEFTKLAKSLRDRKVSMADFDQQLDGLLQSQEGGY